MTAGISFRLLKHDPREFGRFADAYRERTADGTTAVRVYVWRLLFVVDWERRRCVADIQHATTEPSLYEDTP